MANYKDFITLLQNHRILIVTLAAVTIFAFTESGLLKTSSKWTENYANAQEYEKQIMNNIDKKVDDVVKNITGENGNDNPVEEFNIDQEYQFTGSEQSVTLKPGIYEIECYGSEGGRGKDADVYKYEGGKGAYTKGIITLTEETTLYLYVGGKGGDAPKGNGALGVAGGYYGGFGGTVNTSRTLGGSGSSYISGHSGCNSVKSVNDSTHTGSAVHYSNLKFENTIMQSGVNSGNGKIIIKNVTK